MKIVLVADTWEPDINAVAVALKNLYDQLVKLDHDVFLLHPGMFETVPFPGFPHLRLALHPEYLRFVLKNLKFDAIHIATEGPIGWAARDYCVKKGLTYTSAYHSNSAEILKTKYKIPLWLSYRVLRKFHKHSAKVLVNTESLKQLLLDNEFKRVEVLSLESLGLDQEEQTDRHTALKFLKLQAFKYDSFDD